MSLDVYSRRKYKQGKFVYLLDDEEKTAWMKKVISDDAASIVCPTM